MWNNRSSRIYVIIAKAKQYLEQWRYAQRITTITRFPQLHEGDGGSAWVKPQMMQIKVSVDAATFREFQSSGIGMVARDDKGELLLARTVYFGDVYSAEMAEGLAIKEALSWIKSQAWQEVVIESDCLAAVQAVRSKVRMRSPYGRIIEDCRRLLENQNTVSLLFIKRSANMAAHELARVSYSFPDRVFDRSSVPIGVENALIADSY